MIFGKILLTPKVVTPAKEGRDVLKRQSTRFRHLLNKEIHATPHIPTHLTHVPSALFFLAIHIFALV
jgi:hypothetical protein